MAGLKTTICLANTEGYKKLVSLVKEVLSDVRVDEDIRNEYIVNWEGGGLNEKIS